MELVLDYPNKSNSALPVLKTISHCVS